MESRNEIPLSHQSKVLQKFPICGLNVPSSCGGVISATGMLVWGRDPCPSWLGGTIQLLQTCLWLTERSGHDFCGKLVERHGPYLAGCEDCLLLQWIHWWAVVAPGLLTARHGQDCCVNAGKCDYYPVRF